MGDTWLELGNDTFPRGMSKTQHSPAILTKSLSNYTVFTMNYSYINKAGSVRNVKSILYYILYIPYSTYMSSNFLTYPFFQFFSDNSKCFPQHSPLSPHLLLYLYYNYIYVNIK